MSSLVLTVTQSVHFVKQIKKLSDDEIMDVEIPNFPPLVFEFDDNLNVQNEYYLAPKKA